MSETPQTHRASLRKQPPNYGESLLSEFWSFLAQNKKWWLLPIVIVMLFLGTLIFLSGTAVTRSSTLCSEARSTRRRCKPEPDAAGSYFALPWLATAAVALAIASGSPR